MSGAAILIDRLGQSHAATLVGRCGGTRLHVPGRLANADRLKRLLGDDLAVLVVLHFGDSRMTIPRTLDGPGGPRTPLDLRKVKRLVARGWSSARIARHLGCTERTIEAKRALIRSHSRGQFPESGK